MKTKRKALTLAVATLFGLSLGISTATAAPIELTWWHSMGGDLGQEVNKLADGFNKSQSEYVVKPIYKGQYAESMTQAIAAFRSHQQPDILQVFEVGTGTMLAAKQAVVPVYKLMHDQGIKFSTSQFVPAVAGYYSDSHGNLLSMPFNSSSPVLFYNKDLFKKAGLTEPPKTWAELESDAKKLKDSGAKCGFTTAWQSWINLENYSAWNNVPFATNEDGYTGLDTKLLINTKPFVQHIERLGRMVKEGLFEYGGRFDKPEPLFLSGSCAMYLQSSGDIVGFTKDAPFGVGVAMMPYNSDLVSQPQNSIIGGATLWVLSGKPDSHYKGIAEFLAYLAQPRQQAQWSQATGYVPVTKAAFELNKSEGYYKKFPGAMIPVEELSLHEPTKNSKGIRLGNYLQIREIINQELEAVWSGNKTAQQALDAAVERGNRQLKRFEQAHSH